MDKPRLIYPVIVEGKYDKVKIESLFDATVLTTDGFGIFNRAEKQDFFRRIAKKSPLIVLTDSDGAGNLIRRFFKDALPADRLIQLYTPQIPGKERRKSAPSKEGFLGVEGVEADLLRSLLAPYIDSVPSKAPGTLRRIDLYERGYIGAPESAEKRKRLCRRCALPDNLSTSALLDALNLLFRPEELETILNEKTD